MIKLKDIAAAAGVTQATASMALSHKGRMAEKTRNRILKIADEMNYQPNRIAQIMRNKPTVDVGFLTQLTNLNVVNEFIAWCSKYHLRHQLEIVSNAENSPCPMLLNERIAEGILYFGYLSPQVEAFIVGNPQYPLVCLNEHSSYCVRSDFANGGKQVIQYLAALGHRRIAMSVGDQNFDMHQQMATGLLAATQEYGLEIHKGYHPFEINGADSKKNAAISLEWARRTLRLSPRPTALVCSGMITAHAVIHAAYELNIKVPEELSIVAIGYPTEADSCYPALTILSHNFAELVAQGMLLLQQRIKNPDLPPQDIKVSPLLLINESTIKNMEKQS